jgi:hypothetical protein
MDTTQGVAISVNPMVEEPVRPRAAPRLRSMGAYLTP